ncbi:PP2C family protein-serine/threonine phosphatase [Streptomyces sp. ALI-76-A]|uniref:PP2C family protein-serine/threonine phosphatase n=1 Tax=Streptomyces sp. ALI-76-A TaxID=3025736 RepID=UPI00256F6489|nr:PP2C family protein-serine/threonine phosphatase [Streptomyces sp. ALI-76-A]MDL5199204.1 PP2C family protein-serine/threonine phosphatase [Streptomyces sp. ALI-76-A]
MSLGLFEAITKPLPHPVVLCAGDGRILAANPAATASIPQLQAGASLYALAQDDPGALRAHLGNWLRSGSPLPGALVIKDSDGSRTRFRCHGVRATWWQGAEPVVQLHLHRLDHADRFTVLSQQVSALNREIAIRRTAEAQREELLLAEQAARARLQRLYQLTAALASSATLAQVAEAVATTAARVLEVDGVTLELHSQRLVPALEPGEDLRVLTETAWKDLDQPCDIARTMAVGAVRIALEADGVVLGALTVHPGSGGVPEPEHLTAVGQQIAQAVRRAGLYEHEHRVAERLQLSLLPRLPGVAGLEVATCYAPGSDMVMVGGDWYDLYDLDEDHIGLSTGDVAGHGLPQAAVMAQIIAALRGIVLRCGTHPQAVLTELNEYLHLYHRGQMATAAYLLYHRPTRALTYVKAGHPPPLVVRPDGSSRYLDGPISPPVGPVPGAHYRQGETVLAEGEAVLLYTDGLIERRGEPLDTGFDRLTATARRGAGLNVPDLCELFLNHQPGADYPDDRALLLARPDPPGPPGRSGDCRDG